METIFKGPKSMNITIQQLKSSLGCRLQAEAEKVKVQINKLEGSFVPKDCLSYLLGECSDLYLFREVVKDFIQLKQKENQQDDDEQQEEEELNAKQRYEQKKNKLQQSDKQQFTKLENSCNKESHLSLDFLTYLSDFASSNTYAQNKVLQLKLKDQAEKASLFNKIYEALQQNHHRREQMQAFKSTLDKFNVDRQEKQDSIKQLQKQLDDIHAQYLQKFKSLCELCPQQDLSKEIEQVKQQRDIDHSFNILHDILTKHGPLFKNANFYNNMVDRMKQYLIQVGAPLRERPNSQESQISFIVVDEDDAEEELKRIIHSYKEIYTENEAELKKTLQENRVIAEKQKEMDNQVITWKAQLEKLKDGNHKLQQQIQAISKQNKKFMTDLQRITQEKQNTDKQVKSMMDKINNMIRLNNQLTSEKQALTITNKDIQNKKTTLQNEKQQLLQKITQNQRQIEQLIKQIAQNGQKYQLELQNLTQRIEQTKNLHLQQQLKRQITEKTLQAIRANQQKASPVIRSKPIAIVPQPSYIQPVGNIFSNLSTTLCDASLQFQLNLQLNQKRHFHTAQLLYRFDPKNKTNVHEYIDNKRNLLLVVKTTTKIIGAFCNLPLIPKQKGINADSFLFSYSDYHLSSYSLIEGKGAFEYSKDFLIFGKSDLRIQIGKDKLSSNFALQSSHYVTNGHKVKDFLEEKGRDATIVTYELFQLIGEGEAINEKQQQKEEMGEMREDKQLVNSTVLEIQELNLQQKVAQLTSQLLNKKQQIRELTQKLSNAQQLLQQNIDNHNRETQNWKDTHKMIIQQNLQVTQQLKRQLTEKTNEHQTSLQVIKQAKEGKQALQKHIITLQQQLERMRQENRQLLQGDKEKLLSDRVALLQSQLSKHHVNQQQIKRLLEEETKNKSKISKLQSIFTELESKHEEVKLELQLKDSQLQDAKLQNDSLSTKNLSLQEQKTSLTLKHIKLSTDYQSLRQKMLQNRDYNIYFPNELLSENLTTKRFMIKNIQQAESMMVSWTRLLYRYDPLNKTNFHRYIDGLPNIFLLLKLKNKRIIGCYSNQAFGPGCKGDNALLMVSGTQSIFYLKKGMKAITYDQYYLIFGNSEIRLKSGEGVVFSNFGIANSHFEHNHCTVDALFGEGKDGKELPIEGYEIYQLFFH